MIEKKREREKRAMQLDGRDAIGCNRAAFEYHICAGG